MLLRDGAIASVGAPHDVVVPAAAPIIDCAAMTGAGECTWQFQKAAVTVLVGR